MKIISERDIPGKPRPRNEHLEDRKSEIRSFLEAKGDLCELQIFSESTDPTTRAQNERNSYMTAIYHLAREEGLRAKVSHLKVFVRRGRLFCRKEYRE